MPAAARVTSRLLIACLAAAFLFLPCLARAGELEERRGEWVSQLFWFLGGVGSAAGIYGILRRKPPIEAEFATKRELAQFRDEKSKEIHQLKLDLDDIRKQIRIDYENIQRAAEARASGLHVRINAVLEGLAELKGSFEETRKTVDRIVAVSLGERR